MKIDLADSLSYVGGHPFDQYSWLRDHDPVHWHEHGGEGGGFWALTRYPDVKSVSRSRHFTSVYGCTLYDLDSFTMDAWSGVLLFMDPPEHLVKRDRAQGWFNRGAVSAMTEAARDIAAEVVDSVIERGECDLVTEVTGMMPLYFIADILGFPRSEAVPIFTQVALTTAPADQVTHAEREGAIKAIYEFATEVKRDKQRNPGHDLSSALTDPGHPHALSDEDYLSYFLLVLTGGSDTVRHGLADGLLTLLANPEQWNLLRAQGDRVIGSAVEEVLRWSSPVAHMRRTAKQDVEVGGQKIAAGQKVVMFYGSANRDESVFERPDEFDISRTRNPHFAFGSGGPHLCLGAGLARLEMAALLLEVARRMPDLEVTGDTTWVPSCYIMGPEHVPVSFSPGPRSVR